MTRYDHRGAPVFRSNATMDLRKDPGCSHDSVKPPLSTWHAVTVAGSSDPDLDALVREPPVDPVDVYRTAAALGVLDARATVAAKLRRAGADVVEAPPDALAAACVRAYLREKWTARF